MILPISFPRPYARISVVLGSWAYTPAGPRESFPTGRAETRPERRTLHGRVKLETKPRAGMPAGWAMETKRKSMCKGTQRSRLEPRLSLGVLAAREVGSRCSWKRCGHDCKVLNVIGKYMLSNNEVTLMNDLYTRMYVARRTLDGPRRAPPGGFTLGE